MINYKLALVLKKAGFPQKEPNQYRFMQDGTTERVYFPILSELVEEMPMRQKYLGTVNDAHFVLRKLVSSKEGGEYRAYYEDEDTNEIVPGYEFVGDADVAVAKLYIKLNERHSKRR